MSDTPASTEPLWRTAAPLPVPEKARDVDLATAYGRLVIRAGALRQRRTEEAREARERERRLLTALIETDDDLLALLRGRGLSPTRASGVEAARRRLHRRLAAFGVKEIDLEGRAVNTAYAEIAGTEETDAVAPDTVVETMAACFVWQGEVLRPGRVFVAVPASARAGDESTSPGDDETPDAESDGRETEGRETEGRAEAAGDTEAAEQTAEVQTAADETAAGEHAAEEPTVVHPSEIRPPDAEPTDTGAPAPDEPSVEGRSRRIARRAQPKRTTRAQRKGGDGQAGQADGRSGRAR